MKRVLFAVVAVAAGLAIPAAAQAQDANGRGGWGCSVGVHFAERWGNDTFTKDGTWGGIGTTIGVRTPATSYGSQAPDAQGYGAQFNCDWHSGNWVFGAQIQHDNGVGGTNVLTAVPADQIRASAISLESFTGRAGYMVAPDLLAYVRTGVSIAFNNFNVTTIVNGAPVEFASNRALGLVFGGGLEYSIDSDWSVYGEFDTNIMGSTPVNFTTVGPISPPAGDIVRVRQSINQLLIGVNYHL